MTYNIKASIPHRPVHGGSVGLPDPADSAPPPTRLLIPGTPSEGGSSGNKTHKYNFVIEVFVAINILWNLSMRIQQNGLQKCVSLLLY